MTFFVFPSSSFIGRSLPVEPFSFTGAIGISDGCCFGANSGYYARSFCFYAILRLFGYIYLYILLLCYIAIYLYFYIGIVLFVYCFIACLQYGGITFFISIFYFCSLLRPLFFIIVVAVSLSFGFLRCKGMAVLSDTKHQAMPYSAKTFPECLPQMLHIWVFQKTFYRIVWCSDSWNHHFLMHVKRLYDDEMTE